MEEGWGGWLVGCLAGVIMVVDLVVGRIEVCAGVIISNGNRIMVCAIFWLE